MACYIGSMDNRFYASVEAQYGQTPAVTAAHRFGAVSLVAKQVMEKLERKDKRGTRTFGGLPAGTRTTTSFGVKTYLMTTQNPAVAPSYGPLVESALGGSPRVFSGATVEAIPGWKQIRMVSAHGLQVGQGVAFGGEMRFVEAIVDARTVELNAPFSIQPGTGTVLGASVSYAPARTPKSVSLYDYWGPETAVQRIVCGAAVDRMRVQVNGDFHEFEFAGPAMDLIDSVSFAAGQGQLSQFPVEPAAADFDPMPVPGHLGQAWMGVLPEQFYTITNAEFVMDNNLDMRAREFGSSGPRCVVAGPRTVNFNFNVYERDDAATRGLFEAAKQRSPITVMFQLGQQGGQLFGIYLKSVVPEVPDFDDRETRLQWRFSGCRAQGSLDDEIFVAFG
jgi:hypothetical protein